jgi:hypothetical protein
MLNPSDRLEPASQVCSSFTSDLSEQWLASDKRTAALSSLPDLASPELGYNSRRLQVTRSTLGPQLAAVRYGSRLVEE